MDNQEYEIITRKIMVYGIVQGVGFRPHTYHLAKKYMILGTVRNMGGAVEIITQSRIQDFEEFLNCLKKVDWESCEITHYVITDMHNGLQKYMDFQILESDDVKETSIIPPDLCICKSCEEELYSVRNRRFKNPFISCMSCGPRYTIIEKIPYDRENTTMGDFEMCKNCSEEYVSPESRRFHAQTISCDDCGPHLILSEHKEVILGNKVTAINEEALTKAIAILKSGGIIGLKGIGGYHFVCTPFYEQTVENLRQLKGRYEKPFAVMFESTKSIMEYCEVSKEEMNLLESKARPIVLLYSDNLKMAESTSKKSIYCGAFLPYTPLQSMILRSCGPMIMTSANRSNHPIIKEDAEIISLKNHLLQAVLYNKRRIVRSVDDSIVKVIDHKLQILRRSRGYVPYPILLKNCHKKIQIFAAGGDLKAAFCVYKNDNAVVSQYFGDLEEKTIYDDYRESVLDLSRLLNISPDIAICDLHPGYLSSKYVKTLGIPIYPVQHHHAHIASVMAEHDLRQRVIGVAFDGTGYGADGNIWGGEFLVCEGANYKRVAHLKYTPILGGDQSMRDAKKTATCFLLYSKLNSFVEDDRVDIIEAALKNSIHTVLTSSMGRLFDVVASILKIEDENHYEGECAIQLERQAFLAIRNKKSPKKMLFTITKYDHMIEIDSSEILETLCIQREKSDIQSLSLGFHYAVAEMVLNICKMIQEQEHIDVVALSGGVFQNTVLLELLLKILRDKKFQVYYNILVPPNDGSISLGQTFIGLMR